MQLYMYLFNESQLFSQTPRCIVSECECICPSGHFGEIYIISVATVSPPCYTHCGSMTRIILWIAHPLPNQ